VAFISDSNNYVLLFTKRYVNIVVVKNPIQSVVI